MSDSGTRHSTSDAQALQGQVLQSTIGKYKNRTSDWGIERLFIVEAVKEASLPLKQIQVSRREFGPRRALAVPSHSFMDEKQIRPRNGLVVQTSLSLRKGVSPERSELDNVSDIQMRAERGPRDGTSQPTSGPVRTCQ